MTMQANIEILNKRLAQEDNLDELLLTLLSELGGKNIFSTSFSKEDQILLEAIARLKLSVDVFTLDTGRLFTETYNVWGRTKEKYGLEIKAYHPEAQRLEALVTTHGPNMFYESTALRKQCCEVRKVLPLARALNGYDVWITGIRSAHSEGRAEMNIIEWDEQRKMYKVNPLLLWSDDRVNETIISKQIPYNILYDKGFLSIGCAPCTRAVKAGEPARAGRWWWEDNSKKECGLHT